MPHFSYHPASLVHVCTAGLEFADDDDIPFDISIDVFGQEAKLIAYHETDLAFAQFLHQNESSAFTKFMEETMPKMAKDEKLNTDPNLVAFRGLLRLHMKNRFDFTLKQCNKALIFHKHRRQCPIEHPGEFFGQVIDEAERTVVLFRGFHDPDTIDAWADQIDGLLHQLKGKTGAVTRRAMLHAHQQHNNKRKRGGISLAELLEDSDEGTD